MDSMQVLAGLSAPALLEGSLAWSARPDAPVVPVSTRSRGLRGFVGGRVGRRRFERAGQAVPVAG